MRMARSRSYHGGEAVRQFAAAKLFISFSVSAAVGYERGAFPQMRSDVERVPPCFGVFMAWEQNEPTAMCSSTRE